MDCDRVVLNSDIDVNYFLIPEDIQNRKIGIVFVLNQILSLLEYEFEYISLSPIQFMGANGNSLLFGMDLLTKCIELCLAVCLLCEMELVLEHPLKMRFCACLLILESVHGPIN